MLYVVEGNQGVKENMPFSPDVLRIHNISIISGFNYFQNNSAQKDN